MIPEGNYTVLVIENSYSKESEARAYCRYLIKSGKVEEAWIVEGRTGRAMIALFETRDRKTAEKKVMEYYNKGMLTAIWLEDGER